MSKYVSGARPRTPAPEALLIGVRRRGGAVLLVCGVLVSLCLQWWLGGHPASLAIVFILLCLCGCGIAVLLTNAMPSAAASVAQRAEDVAAFRALPFGASARRAILPYAGAVAGLVCALFGASQVAAHPWSAQMWWLAALILPILGLLGERALSWRAAPHSIPRVAKRELGIVALLLALALALRVPGITVFEPFVHGDEAMCGLTARTFLDGQAPVLSIGWSTIPMLSYAILSLGLRLFGDTLAGLRMADALTGSAAVVLVYLLGRELFSRRAALFSGLLLATGFLHLEYSRNGNHAIQGPTCVTLTLLLFVLWIRHGGALFALLAGMSIILDLQVYLPARVAPLLVLFLLAYLLVGERHLLMTRWRESPWVGIGLAAAGLPIAALFLANPGSFGGHQTAVNIFGGDPETTAWVRSTYGTTAIIPVLAQQAWRIVTTFSARGDTSLIIGWPGGMLDTVSAALLPAAVGLALLRWRHWSYVLPLAWFGAVAGAGMLTTEAPWWPRLATLLPAVALLIGVLLADAAGFLQERLQQRRTLVTLGVVAVLSCIVVGNMRLVFVDFPAFARQASPMEGTLVGRYLAHAPDATHAVLLSDGSMYVDYESVRFLAPHAIGCTLMPGTMPGDSSAAATCPFARTSRLYVMLPGRVGDLAALERERPGGTAVTVGTYGYGASRIVAYTLPSTRSSVARVINHVNHVNHVHV